MPSYVPSVPDDLVEAIAQALHGVYRDSAGNAIDAFDLGIDWEYVDPKAIEYAQQHGAELVGRKRLADGSFVDNPNAEWAITRTQRETVQALLDEAVREGWSMDDFAGRLRDSGTFDDARADMIARTETAIAQNKGQVDTMRGAGVEQVYVYDGECDECSAVDGEIWTVDEAAANPLAHPACVRAFSPVPSIGDIE